MADEPHRAMLLGFTGHRSQPWRDFTPDRRSVGEGLEYERALQAGAYLSDAYPDLTFEQALEASNA